jgi:hypothetical protein
MRQSGAEKTRPSALVVIYSFRSSDLTATMSVPRVDRDLLRGLATLASDDYGQGPEHLVHRLGVREDAGHVGIEDDDSAPRREAPRILAANAVREVVLLAHLGHPDRPLTSFHTPFVHAGSPAVR